MNGDRLALNFGNRRRLTRGKHQRVCDALTRNPVEEPDGVVHANGDDRAVSGEVGGAHDAADGEGASLDGFIHRCGWIESHLEDPGPIIGPVLGDDCGDGSGFLDDECLGVGAASHVGDGVGGVDASDFVDPDNSYRRPDAEVVADVGDENSVGGGRCILPVEGDSFGGEHVRRCPVVG